MQWPAGAEDGWLLRQVELKANEVLGKHGMREFGAAVIAENHAKVDELMHKLGVPTSWRLLPWNPEVEWRLDSVAYPQSGWAHLRDGVWGSRLNLRDPGFTPFTNMPELIALLGESLAFGKQLARM